MRLLLSLCLLTLAAALPAQPAIEGRVVGVHDGDTLTLLLPSRQTAKIRLAGIDAPEAKQDFGAAAKQALSDLVFDQQVQVTVQSQDRYRRLVGDVTVGRTWVNHELVARGLAWVYRQYPHAPSLIAAEAAARKRKLGLWSRPDPVPPWLFRKK